MPDAVQEAVRTAVTGGMHGVVLGTALLGAAAFAVAWLVREVPLRKE